MEDNLSGNKYQVFINAKLIVSGKFSSRWAAFLAAVDIYGMDRTIGALVIRPVK